MKRIVIALSVSILIFAISIQAQTAAQTQTESVEQELIKLENEWADAWAKQDVAFFDRLLAGDYISRSDQNSA